MSISDFSWGRAKIVGMTEEGGHWYQKVDGTFILISKEIMKEVEDIHIRPEHGMPGYDPLWEYRWKQTCEEIDQRYRWDKYFNSLTSEQLKQLEEKLSG